ncbi:hypothetical protein CYMTET_52119, partial [Cymbomonas tetramitiformis]
FGPSPPSSSSTPAPLPAPPPIPPSLPSPPPGSYPPPTPTSAPTSLPYLASPPSPSSPFSPPPYPVPPAPPAEEGTAYIESSPYHESWLRAAMDAPEISSIVLRTDVRLTSELPVASRSLSISGECAEALCIVDGGGAFQPFYVQLYWNIDEFIIDRISITNGYAVQGGGIYVDWGNVIITNSQIINCTARYAGGAIVVVSGSVQMNNTVLAGNEATEHQSLGGALYLYSGLVDLRYCEVRENRVQLLGGAVYASFGALQMTHTVFTDNTAVATYSNGGAIYVSNADLMVWSCEFSRNVAKLYDGGALYLETGYTELRDTIFSSNAAKDWGGAVNFANGTLSISGCIFTGNIAKLGGAIQLNRYEEGGALVDTLNVVIVDTIFRDNVAEADGGGLSVVEYPDDHLSLSIIDTVLQGNVAYRARARA